MSTKIFMHHNDQRQADADRQLYSLNDFLRKDDLRLNDMIFLLHKPGGHNDDEDEASSQ